MKVISMTQVWQLQPYLLSQTQIKVFFPASSEKNHITEERSFLVPFCCNNKGSPRLRQCSSGYSALLFHGLLWQACVCVSPSAATPTQTHPSRQLQHLFHGFENEVPSPSCTFASNGSEGRDSIVFSLNALWCYFLFVLSPVVCFFMFSFI